MTDKSATKKPATEKKAPLGCWESVITPELITRGAAGYDFTSCDQAFCYWVESRPWEQGRCVIVQCDNEGTQRDLLPEGYSARSAVHEYGGTPYLILENSLIFVNASDQQIYRIDQIDLLSSGSHPGSPQPALVTKSLPLQEGQYHFADFCATADQNLVICVAEYHLPDLENTGNPAPENFLALVNLNSGDVTHLVDGCDFYAYPRVSPCGTELCWISWNHPDMPWDHTRLWRASISQTAGNLSVENPRLVAGKEKESIFQPHWNSKGSLVFVSDRDGWWNLFKQDAAGSTAEALHPMTAECATPLWSLGMTTTVSDKDGSSVFCYSTKGQWHLGKLDPEGHFSNFGLPFVDIYSLSLQDDQVIFVAATTNSPAAVYRLSLSAETPRNQLTQLSKPASAELATRWISLAEPFSFETTDNDICHGFYYPPCNPGYTANGLPPLIVICHGGPTGATSTALNFKIQFWTSRGFAVADVNYRGSTGYGREYREKLHGCWGIKDVNDVIAAARYLVSTGKAHPQQVVIRGSSAGGYTVLAALAFHDFFKGGACLYGIGDLETLAKDTHKFEAHYLDTLVGPYPAERDKYQRLSPIHSASRIDSPVIFFQGMQDKVVPPEQAETMVNALTKNGVTTRYVTFDTEGHGFRQAGNIVTAFTEELAFYRQIFQLDG